MAEYNSGKSQVDKLVKVSDGLKNAINVYNNLLNAPSLVNDFYQYYDDADSIAKTILDDGSAAKLAIKELLELYKSGTFDNDIEKLASSIKNVVNANGYSDLKNELSGINDPDVSVIKLLELLNFLDSVSEGIDDAVQMYSIFKNETMSKLLENSLIEITDNEKSKFLQLLDDIKSNVDDSKSKAQIYAIVINKILSNYENVVQQLNSFLDGDLNDQIVSAQSELSNAKVKLDSGYIELRKGQNEYDDGLKKYNDGIAEIEKNEKLIKKAKQDVVEGKKELEEGKEELEIAKNKVKDFNKKIDEIENYDITLLGRNLNGGVSSTTPPIDMMSSIKYTMVLLFIIVGVFVCYSALSRSVYDQTIQIGTKKALGLSRKEVTLSFLMYGTLATIIGCILGVALARFIVEPIILNILAKNYIVSSNKYYFDLKSSLLFMLFELVVTNLTSFLACNKALNKKAIKLLQGPEDLIGKSHFYEKFSFWNSFSLLTKTIINNCVNDKRRVLSTLVGVAGCCSLMVCAISLITNMHESLDYQLNNVAKFESIAYVDSSVEGSLANIDSKLDEMGIEHFTATYSSNALENSKGDFISGALFIYDDDKFFDFFEVATNGKRKEVGDGICIAKAYAQFNDIEPGDTITILDSLGKKQNIKVSTFFDYYLLRAQTIMTEDSYINVYGKEPIKNAVLIKRGNYTNEQINDALFSIDGYITTFDYLDESVSLYSSLTDAVMIIVITFFALAVVLAFLVLLNLLTMFVDEKKKELIVMMINGYSRKTVKKYIYGDSIVLTVIGILIGTVIGVAVGFATIKTFDSDCVTIMRNINIPSYLICGALTGLLSAICCLIALKKVDKFKLTEINSK